MRSMRFETRSGWCQKKFLGFHANLYFKCSYMGMDQYLLIPFLGGWTSIYQLFWCSPGYKVLTHCHMFKVILKTSQNSAEYSTYSIAGWLLHILSLLGGAVEVTFMAITMGIKTPISDITPINYAYIILYIYISTNNSLQPLINIL